MDTSSPYYELATSQWPEKTRELINAHPLDEQELVGVALESWSSIFESRIGISGFTIGEHIFPKPQIMGFLLHELVPLEFASRYPDVWRGEETAEDKDLVYVPEPSFSIEIKTSSSRKNIYGNRSYAQDPASIKKSKSGYYLAINFEKFSATSTQPRIRLVRFGWLDHEDWVGQTASTGQQAKLNTYTEQSKLLTLFSLE